MSNPLPTPNVVLDLACNAHEAKGYVVVYGNEALHNVLYRYSLPTALNHEQLVGLNKDFHALVQQHVAYHIEYIDGTKAIITHLTKYMLLEWLVHQPLNLKYLSIRELEKQYDKVIAEIERRANESASCDGLDMHMMCGGSAMLHGHRGDPFMANVEGLNDEGWITHEGTLRISAACCHPGDMLQILIKMEENRG